MKKWLIRISVALVVVVVLGGGLAWGYLEAMKRAWIHYNEYDIRSEGTLRVGHLVPEFELATADGSGVRVLSDLYRERPLVLVFGSYT